MTLYNDVGARPFTVTKDVRQIGLKDVEGFDAVVHLAELSNDPLGELSECTTYTINHLGSVMLARTCKRAGLADASFSPVFLRNATAFGASPRMRFDVVLNNLAGFGWTTKETRLAGDGTPWRPLVHIEDICQAIILALEAPREAVHNEILNVGDDGQNYRVRDIAAIVAQVLDGCTISTGLPNGDNRSYRTSFDKIGRHLPEFRCRWSAERGTRQLREIFEHVGLTREAFFFRGYTRLEQLKHLIGSRQIDADFYWRPPGEHEPGHQSK